MVPGFNDAVWKALLPSQQLPFFGSRISPSVAIRPCLTPTSSMKQEVVSTEVVRRALYSAALNFMSSEGHLQCNQPRLILPQHHQYLGHHHHQQQQQQGLMYGELVRHHEFTASSDNHHYHHHAGSVASLITSPLGDLHDGM